MEKVFQARGRLLEKPQQWGEVATTEKRRAHPVWNVKGFGSVGNPVWDHRGTWRHQDNDVQKHVEKVLGLKRLLRSGRFTVSADHIITAYMMDMLRERGEAIKCVRVSRIIYQNVVHYNDLNSYIVSYQRLCA